MPFARPSQDSLWILLYAFDVITPPDVFMNLIIDDVFALVGQLALKDHAPIIGDVPVEVQS